MHQRQSLPRFCHGAQREGGTGECGINAVNDFLGSDEFTFKTVPTDCLYLKNMSVAYISSRRKNNVHIDLSEK